MRPRRAYDAAVTPRSTSPADQPAGTSPDTPKKEAGRPRAPRAKAAAKTTKAPAKTTAKTTAKTATKATKATKTTKAAAKTPAKKQATTPTPPSRPSRAESALHDVVIVGAGPSGASCAYWLAEAGWDVVMVEKKHFPRVKTCGDGPLTPARPCASWPTWG